MNEGRKLVFISCRMVLNREGACKNLDIEREGCSATGCSSSLLALN